MVLLSWNSFLKGHALRLSEIHSFEKFNDSLHLGQWHDLWCLFSHHNMPTASEWKSHFIQVCPELCSPHHYSFVLPISNPIMHTGSCHRRCWSFFNHIKPFGSLKCLFQIGQKLGGQRNDTVITDEWRAGGAATSSRQLLPAFPLNHGLFPSGYTCDVR